MKRRGDDDDDGYSRKKGGPDRRRGDDDEDDRPRARESRYRYDDRPRSRGDDEDMPRSRRDGDERPRARRDDEDRPRSRRDAEEDRPRGRIDDEEDRPRARRDDEERPRSRNNDGEPKTDEEDQPKEQPNFGLSGALAAEGNTFKGVLLKYRVVADIPIDHPSCSKQHAVIQFRQVLMDGAKQVRFGKGDILGPYNDRPYIIDLESSNGTFINTEKISPSRYYELKISDTIKFGFSSRDYVLMAEELVN
ncbi:Smad nuclear-interacting protein 1 [Phlyctochytrium bullatum]|nr:Smad nuclear-interacting protein 1 [Phlyctochytrium bullatum]